MADMHTANAYEAAHKLAWSLSALMRAAAKKEEREMVVAHADVLLCVIEDMAGQGCTLSDLIGTPTYQEFRELVQGALSDMRKEGTDG